MNFFSVITRAYAIPKVKHFIWRMGDNELSYESKKKKELEEELLTFKEHERIKIMAWSTFKE